MALIRWLPGGYYLATRYSTPLDRAGYLVKYWLPFPVLLWTLDPSGAWWHWTQFLSLAAFLAVYDAFCLYNDVWSAATEAHPLERFDGTTLPRSVHLRRRILVAAATSGIALAATAATGGTATAQALFLVVLGLVFALHNALPERGRIGTFFGLYLLKGGVFLCPRLPSPFPADLLPYLWFTFLYGAIYLPSYTLRKFHLLAGRPGLLRWLSFVLPLKTALLAGLVVWNPRLWTVPAIVFGGTVAQWAARKIGGIATGTP